MWPMISTSRDSFMYLNDLHAFEPSGRLDGTIESFVVDVVNMLAI